MRKYVYAMGHFRTRCQSVGVYRLRSLLEDGPKEPYVPMNYINMREWRRSLLQMLHPGKHETFYDTQLCNLREKGHWQWCRSEIEGKRDIQFICCTNCLETNA